MQLHWNDTGYIKPAFSEREGINTRPNTNIAPAQEPQHLKVMAENFN